MKKKCILIVEDEVELAEVVEYNLVNEGYLVKVANNGADAFACVDASPPVDLVILDLMLPDISGLEICKKFRAASALQDVPIIMLTAKGEEIDRVVGFEVGADDYVTKPFSVRELMLRIRSLLKRAESQPESVQITVFGDLKIDFLGHRVWVTEIETTLTALEFRLLTTLYNRKGRVQSRDVLLGDVWDVHTDVTTRTVDTHVKRLREKIGIAGRYVETVRGVGYRFSENPK